MAGISHRIASILFLFFSYLSSMKRIPSIFSCSWCTSTFTADDNPNRNYHNKKHHIGGCGLSVAFSIVKDTSLSTAMTAPVRTRRRDFLSNILGGIVVVTTVVPTTTSASTTTTSTTISSTTTTTTVSPTASAGFVVDMHQQNSTMSGVLASKGGRRFGALANRIRAVGHIMDELQRDLMQERWDLVGPYPTQLRSYVPIFTTYTDSAFPSDSPTDTGLRVALRYEVGRFFAALERFKQASQRQSLQEAYIAYSEMSLHLDRYMRVGGVYTYYDDMISTEPYFANFTDDTLVFADPKKDPPLERDLVVLVAGPDKGKTGIMIGRYQDGSETAVIKLDRYKGMREIRLVPNLWVAKRLGEQDPDDVFLIPRK